jgi:hypothetical protein
MARPVGSPRGLLPRFRPGATAALPAAGAAAGGACCVCCRAQGMAAGAPGSTAGSPCREASCRIIAAQPACRPPASCTAQVGSGTQRSAGLQDMAHVQGCARQHPEQGLHEARGLTCELICWCMLVSASIPGKPAANGAPKPPCAAAPAGAWPNQLVERSSCGVKGACRS